MIVTAFTKKYNKTTSSYMTEEKHVMPANGIYEAELEHDNVNENSINVYTGVSMTGTRLPFTLTAPPDAPWKRAIHVETEEAVIYISYESSGDQVEADDINKVQDAIAQTQTFVNTLADDIRGSSSGFTWNRLMGITSSSGISITTQPTDVSVTAGSDAEFTITASSSGGDVTYRWQYEESGSSIWSDVSGGTQSLCHVSAVTTNQNGRRYRCIVSDASGNTEISSTATLLVTS